MNTKDDQTINRRTCLAASVPAMALGLAQASAAESTQAPLFAAIRRGKLKPGTAEEFASDRRRQHGAFT